MKEKGKGGRSFGEKPAIRDDPRTWTQESEDLGRYGGAIRLTVMGTIQEAEPDENGKISCNWED